MVNPPDRHAAIATEFRVASERLFTNAPGYQRLAAFIADQPALIELAAAARPEQPAVLMLLGAVRFLLLEGLEHPLGGHYDRLAAGLAVEDGLCDAFLDLCVQHRAALVPLLAAGRVQTNEVGRSLYLRLGLEWLAATENPGPLWYIEIGASAGLNLGWESFSMTYLRDDAILQRGPAGSPVQLQARLLGARTPTEDSATLPVLRGHRGLEINPPDLSRREDRNWLLAFVWVDHGDRFLRTRGAIELAAAARLPLLAADVTTGLVPAAADLPPVEPICVAHTFLLSQLPPAALARLNGELAQLSATRRVYLVGVEWEEAAGTFLQVTRWAAGRAQSSQRLAVGDAHGRTIRWL